MTALETLIEGYYQQVWPEQAGESIRVEWAQFWPDSPWFAVPCYGPRPWPFPMLVEPVRIGSTTAIPEWSDG